MKTISKKSSAIAFFLTIFFFIAFVQPFGLSPDYDQYELFFNEARFDITTALESRFEPAFKYITILITSIIENNKFVYSILATISIYIKLRVTRDTSSGNFFYLACALLLIRFAPLHELTQLRASIAIAICVIIFYLYQFLEKRKIAVAFIFLAGTFHYSSLIVAPFLLLPKLGRSASIAFSIFIYIILKLTSNNLNIFFENQLFNKGGYNPLAAAGTSYNLLSPVFFPEFFMILTGIILWNKMPEMMRKIIVIQMVGFSVFYALSEYQTLAVRTKEFFSVFWVLFLAQANGPSYSLKASVLIFFVGSICLGYYLFFYLNFFN